MMRNLGELLRSSLILLLILAVFAGYVFTEGSYAQNDMKLKPGNYEVTVKMRSSLDSSLSKKTNERCIQGNTINPKLFLPDAQNCNMLNLTKTGSKSSFDITCTSPDGTMKLTGRVEYEVQETSFSYKLSLESPHRGEILKIDYEGDAVRKGECT